MAAPVADAPTERGSAAEQDPSLHSATDRALKVDHLRQPSPVTFRSRSITFGYRPVADRYLVTQRGRPWARRRGGARTPGRAPAPRRAAQAKPRPIDQDRHPPRHRAGSTPRRRRGTDRLTRCRRRGRSAAARSTSPTTSCAMCVECPSSIGRRHADAGQPADHVGLHAHGHAGQHQQQRRERTVRRKIGGDRPGDDRQSRQEHEFDAEQDRMAAAGADPPSDDQPQPGADGEADDRQCRTPGCGHTGAPAQRRAQEDHIAALVGREHPEDPAEPDRVDEAGDRRKDDRQGKVPAGASIPRAGRVPCRRVPCRRVPCRRVPWWSLRRVPSLHCASPAVTDPPHGGPDLHHSQPGRKVGDVTPG